jgi:DNA polymerase III sliding clamp (beta) subunit (PCNA family)
LPSSWRGSFRVDGAQLTAAFERGRLVPGYLCPGFHLELEAGWLLVVTTDGHRLTLSKLEAEGAHGEGRLTPGYVLPEDAELSFSGPIWCQVDDGGLTFDGVYAPVKEHSATQVQLSRSHFRKLLRQVRKGHKRLPLRLTASRELVLEHESASEARWVLPVPAMGPSCVLGVNAAYLAEAVDAMDSDEFQLGLHGPLAPMLLRGTHVEVVLMPCRLNDSPTPR